MYPPVGRISLVTGVPLVVSTFESQVETAASSVSKTRSKISRFHRPVLPSSAVAIVRLRPRKMQMFVQGTKDKKKKEGMEKNVNTWLDTAVESTFVFFSSPPLFPLVSTGRVRILLLLLFFLFFFLLFFAYHAA